MRATLTADDFRPHLGKIFRVIDRDDTLTFVTLDETPQHGSPDTLRQAFALILRGRHHPVLPEGAYRFEVDGDAPFDLYIMPVHTSARDHQDYQIVFN
jgi:hypothetical protein